MCAQTKGRRLKGRGYFDVPLDPAATPSGVSPEIARNRVDRLSLDYLVGLCAKACVVVKVKTAA
jgi:hypothetical protein